MFFSYVSVLKTKQYPVEFIVSTLFEKKKPNELLTDNQLRDKAFKPVNTETIINWFFIINTQFPKDIF